jgi:hypothetical protein
VLDWTRWWARFALSDADLLSQRYSIGCYAECKVDADVVPIEVGDLLTASSTPGHAQKVLDRSRAVGAIVGKALKAVEKGKATIPILVLLH